MLLDWVLKIKYVIVGMLNYVLLTFQGTLASQGENSMLAFEIKKFHVSRLVEHLKTIKYLNQML